MKVDWNPEPRILRQFGFVSLFGFSAIAALAYWAWGAPAWVGWILVGLGVAMALCAALRWHAVIRPVFVGLMLLAVPIGLVISHVLMALIFYLMFTPMALWFRLIGRDALERRLDPEAESYWRQRPQPPSPDRYFKLY